MLHPRCCLAALALLLTSCGGASSGPIAASQVSPASAIAGQTAAPTAEPARIGQRTLTVAVDDPNAGAPPTIGTAAQVTRPPSDITTTRPLVLPPPPFDYAFQTAIPFARTRDALRLVKVSESRNQITDDEAWFQRNNLTLPMRRIPNTPMRGWGDAPSDLPTTLAGNKLVRVIEQPGLLLLMYGENFGGARFVAIVNDRREVVRVFDFQSYRRAPRVLPGDDAFVDQLVQWAHVEGNVLFVSNGHRTYAKSSGGQNAYITALDLQTGDPLWRSAPLVSNSVDFLVQDGFIISGYGFTDEPDFLYVLDASTGKTLGRTSVRSGPDYLVMKDTRLFVRTYDTDYIFDLR